MSSRNSHLRTNS